MTPPNSVMVRPRIGGTRRIKQRHRKPPTRRHRKQRGGFLPSIGEPFVAAAAKYVAPLALFGIYRFLNPTKTRRNRRK